MPEMTPVGDHIIAPNPMTGINSLSGIIGLQQQRQALQTGQYQQQTAQAQATIAQQGAKENQGLAQLMADPVKAGVVDQYGEIAPGAREAILRVAPTTGMQHYDDLIKAATGKVQYQNSWLGLTAQARADISARLAGAVADDNAKPEDAERAITAIRSDYKGTPNEGLTNRMTDIAQDSITRVAPKHGMEGVRSVVNGYSRGALSNPQITGVGGVGVPGAASTAAGVVNRSPTSGALTPPPGAAPGTPINPTPPQIAGQTAQATGGAGIDVDRANQVGSLVQPSKAGIELTQEIDRLADDIGSGEVARAISKTGNYFGMSSLNEARSKMVKDLGQVRGAVAARAGSDAKAQEILAGYPTDTTPTQTIHGSMDYVRGLFKQNIARSELLAKHGQTGFASADNLLTGSANPLMHEFMTLKSPQERIAFYQRNFQGNAQAAQQFKNQVDAFKKHTTLAPE